MSPKSIVKWGVDKLRMILIFFRLHVNAIRKSREICIKNNNLVKIKKNDIILFSVMKNEAHRLPFFLDYYRKLGVDHFILVDNASSDDFDVVVAGNDDVTTFYTEGSYKDSNFGMHWANYLLRKYGSGHWCMTCDPDEFIVYPYMENRDLKDLGSYLDSIREESLFTCMIDMYSDKAVEDSVYQEGTNPLETCPYFDKYGYAASYLHGLRNYWLQGGVRRRVFSRENPDNAPALNKVPFIKWKRHFAYVESMHMAVPRRLNEAMAPSKVTGALLHYKFISQFKEKVEAELVEKQHFNDSREYKQYDQVIKDKTVLYDETVSGRYDSWETLERLGLINKGEW